MLLASWQGYRIDDFLEYTLGRAVETVMRDYDAAIMPLYSSQKEGGKEGRNSLDDRANLDKDID